MYNNTLSVVTTLMMMMAMALDVYAKKGKMEFAKTMRRYQPSNLVSIGVIASSVGSSSFTKKSAPYSN